MATIPWTRSKSRAFADELSNASGTELLVMASRFELVSGRDVPGFLFAALSIRGQMLRAPGSVGVSLIAKPLHKRFFTLSAWQDRDALDAAVARQPHAETMTRFHHRMAASQFVFWTVPLSGLPPDWPDALRRLAEAA